jgi:ribose transport system substrate-binding protein
MKRSGAVLLSIAAWALAIQPAAARAAEPPKVACVLKTLSSQYWKIVAAGAKDAAAKAKVELLLAGPPSEDDVEQQINMIEDALVKRPAVLILAASQPPTVIPSLEKAKRMGISVILVDTDVDWPSKAAFIGTTNVNAGRQGGQYLSTLLAKGDKVVLIDGAPGNPACTDRVSGARESLSAAGMTIAAVQPGYSDRDKAMTVMQNILQAQPDVKAVFAANDEMALGAVRALQQAGRKVPVIGTDGVADAARAVLAGDMAGTVAQQPYEMGRLAVEAAVKLAGRQKIEPRLDSGTRMITRANAQAQLDFLAKIQ